MSQQQNQTKLHVILQICRYISRDYNINIFDKMTESHCTFYVMLWYIRYTIVYLSFLCYIHIVLFATKKNNLTVEYFLNDSKSYFVFN